MHAASAASGVASDSTLNQPERQSTPIRSSEISEGAGRRANSYRRPARLPARVIEKMLVHDLSTLDGIERHLLHLHALA